VDKQTWEAVDRIRKLIGRVRGGLLSVEVAACDPENKAKTDKALQELIALDDFEPLEALAFNLHLLRQAQR